jgi:hypothetical protein
MSNSEYIQYYRSVTPGLAELLLAEFTNTIEPQRTELLKKLYSDAGGALAHISSNNWGRPDGISSLIFPNDHAITKEPHIKVVNQHQYEGNKVVSVRGLGNRKGGKAFNDLIGAASSKLMVLPMFTQWLVVKYDIERVCIGGPHPGGRGSSMHSTSAGLSNTRNGDECRVLLAIPNQSEDDKRDIVIPDGFEKTTYRAFYDMVNSD